MWLALALAGGLAAGCQGGDGGAAARADTGAAADSGAGHWLREAAARPLVADWLLLRAARETRDSAARAALYARVRLPAARERIPWTEATALAHAGDTTGAVRAFIAAGAPVTAFQLRLARDSGTVRAAGLERDLLALVDSAPPAVASQAGGLYLRLVPRPDTIAAAAIGRAAAAAGAVSRAVAAYAAAVRGHAALAPIDRFRFATALAASGRDRDAAREFGAVTAPVSLAAAAGYQRARSLLAAGSQSAAVAALRRVTTAFPRDTSAAAAYTLLADLATDAGNDREARTLLHTVATRFPGTRFAGDAAFQGAITAYALGDLRGASRELAPLASAAPQALAATYWLGRARAALRDSAAARAAWHAVLERDSLSYYAALAGARLGQPSLHVALGGIAYPADTTVDAVARRIAILDTLGLTPEARWEGDRLYRDAARDPVRRLAAADYFARSGAADRAIALGWRALAAGESSPAVLRLIYPLTARDTITAAARRAGIDPALVAALIRQESNFNPRAVSPAGARGLMQLMPAVAAPMARAARITPWSPARLFDPGVNVELGVRHLAPLLRRQPNLARALAAYNAGESRVARWVHRRGAGDPELFTERIPFPETREYVKSVIRNAAAYRALYRWPSAAADAAVTPGSPVAPPPRE